MRRPMEPHLADQETERVRRDLTQRIRDLQDAVGNGVAEFTATAPGIVPASGGDPTKFIAADQTWKVPAGTGEGPGGTGIVRVSSSAYDTSGPLTGDVTTSGDGLATSFRSFSATSVLARASGLSGIPTDLAAGADGELLMRLAGALVWAIPDLGLFGDGSDGAVHLTAGTTTLTRDQFYDTLTMDDGAIIVTNGYRICIKTALVGPSTNTSGGAIIRNNGADGTNASGITPGVGATAVNINTGTICPGSNTTAGNGGSQGSNGSAGGVWGTSARWPNNFAPGAGGAGGNGSSGLTGGAAGGATAGTAQQGTNRALRNALDGVISIGNGAAPIAVAGGGNAGGGAGSAAAAGAAGGGGGSGAGYVSLAAKTITNPSNVTLQANGGKGGNGVTATGSSGGGGGGGGGFTFCVVSYGSLPAMSVTGGAGGTGGSGAQNGVNGGDGQKWGYVLLG